MNSLKGFSLLEVLIVISVVLILAGFAVPSMVTQRQNARLKDALSTIRGDLERARSWAIRENAFVPVIMSADGYTVFVDNGAGGGVAENWLPDGNERILCDRKLPGGVQIDLTQTTFAAHRTRFNGKGYNSNNGILTLLGANGKTARVDMNNRLGRIKTY
jgi:prepilin-type N-terminal cleavage/methylation domain-containing protein